MVLNKKSKVAEKILSNLKSWLIKEKRIDKTMIGCKKLIPGCRWSPKVDFQLRLSNGNRVFIEIEEGQHHPEGNVGKYGWWIEEKHISRDKNIKKVVLIQLFGKRFQNGADKSRFEVCKFLASKMKKSYPKIFSYHHFNFKRSKKEGFEKFKSVLNAYLT